MPTFIDLCCGCGGFSIGLVDAGLQLVAGFDNNFAAIRSFNLNHPGKGVLADIRELHLPEGAADVLVSGLPCQGYSTLGKRDANDPRNQLWEDFLRLVEEVRPLAGAVENVPLYLRSREYEQLRAGLERNGYVVEAGVVSAVNFGVAQRRERAIILFAKGVAPTIPEGKPGKPTVREALAGLPLVPDGKNDHEPRRHGPRTLERFRHVPEGGTRACLPDELKSECWKRTTKGATNSFGRLRWDEPADTLRTAFLKPETGRYIHPSEHRGLTVREGARLQGFRDEHRFWGNMEEKAAQIGNAVPPPVAKAVGEELLRLVSAIAGKVAEAA